MVSEVQHKVGHAFPQECKSLWKQNSGRQRRK